MIIDVHFHPFCKEASVVPNLPDAISRMLESDKELKRPGSKSVPGIAKVFQEQSISDIIALMDKAGIDKACIVAMDLSTRYGVELVTNEDLNRFYRAYPDRFIPFASVDPNMGRLAVDKLIHAVENLSCKGLKLVPPVQHFDFSDPKYDPLWKTAMDLGIPIWTHCGQQKSHPDSDARLGHPMLIEPVVHKFPDLTFILGHCGFPWAMEAWSLVSRHPNVYIDVSVYHDMYTLFPWDAYVAAKAEDKVLFATDWPIGDLSKTIKALDRVDISAEFKEKILWKNAARLLGLTMNP